MKTIVYPHFPAAGRPMELLGLQGPYIFGVAAVFLIDFLLFVIAYCAGVPSLSCLLFALGFGLMGWKLALTLSKQFGPHGLSNHLAARRMPQGMRFDSRRVFLHLLKN